MSRERLLTDAMRRLFVVTTALVIIIAVQLFVLTEQTDRVELCVRDHVRGG